MMTVRLRALHIFLPLHPPSTVTTSQVGTLRHTPSENTTQSVSSADVTKLPKKKKPEFICYTQWVALK